VIEELAGEYSERVRIGKLDVDAQGEIAERYGVQAIPTLLFVRNGRPVERWLGALPAGELRRVLDAQLEPTASA
jgi:thioredoxin 1